MDRDEKPNFKVYSNEKLSKEQFYKSFGGIRNVPEKREK